jgi:nucleotide-binding universal stress UspA family protein
MQISQSGIEENAFNLFTKGAIAGLIVAGVVWVEYASRDTISRLIVVYLAFLCIPFGNLYHVVVSFTEMTYLLVLGEVGVVLGMTDFVIPVLLGNTVGGVVLVTVVNYYQTSERRLGAMQDEAISKLTTREWLFGRFVGRSYVPLLDTHQHTEPADREGQFRLMVPISNPRTDRGLVELACMVADRRNQATVHIVHFVEMPSGTTYQYTGRQRSRITAESRKRLQAMQESLEYDDIDIETSTVVSYNSFAEIFSQASQDEADLVVMGWDENHRWGTLRSGRPLDELTNTLPCDFLVLRDRGLDTSEVLLPTAGGPDSDLSAEVARALRDSVGSTVRLLHVVDSPEARAAGEQFLEEWAAERNLDDAELIVDDSGDVERVIAREAPEHGLVLIGATERGMLSRLARGSLHLQVIDDVDSSVLLAERPHRRSLRQRLFG